MNDLLNISSKLLSENRVVAWGYTEELKPRTYNEYLKWVDDGMHGPLNYLSDHRKDKRESLKEVYPEGQSALVFLFSYKDVKKHLSEEISNFEIASYTVGFDDQDYHFWIKDRLEMIGKKLVEENSGLTFGLSLDIHPVLERDLAYRSGLGWFGKNSMLINKDEGSYTLIGSLILSKKLNLTSYQVDTDHCGNCTRCIEACPTNAIDGQNRSVDASKCISTFTIEIFKDESPPQGYPVESKQIFGCDICQEVCPWNRKPLKNVKIDESVQSELVNFFNRDLENIIHDIENMSNKGFKTFFKGTSFERVGKRGLLKNLKYYIS